MKKMLLIFVFLALSSFAFAQQGQTIYSGGTAYLPEKCPAGCVAVLTINIIWKDLDVSHGGTGRMVVEEAVFTEKEGRDEINFAGVRITPFFPRGEISLKVKCEFKKDIAATAKFEMDKNDKDTPKPMGYGEAAGGKLLNLRLKLKPGENGS